MSAAQSAKRTPAKRPTIHQRQLARAREDINALKLAAAIDPATPMDAAILAVRQMRMRANGGAQIRELLRDASPPFGRTAEVKRAWVEARDNELNRA